MMNPHLPSAASVCLTAFSRGLTPDPVLTVDKWADKHRMLSSKASSQPGPWTTRRTPYLREVMEELSVTSRIKKVVLMFGAQIGKTECGLNWAGYIIHHVPGPMLMVQPTVDMAKRYSLQRIAPMIEATPELSSRILPARVRESGNTILSKEFPGGIIIMTGANSSTGLSSMPTRFLFMDEVDRFPWDIDGEGDPVGLAIKRTANFNRNKKILLTSTPTIKGASRIENSYLASDQREYHVPCPRCKERQVLVWQQVKWLDEDRATAYYECLHCGKPIQNWEKGQMLANGVWIPRERGDGYTAGFHLSSLYSPHGWVSWAEIAQDHEKAKDDPSLLKVWTNTNLALSWEESQDRLDPTGLASRRENWGEFLPAGVARITIGADVQDDRIEAVVVGWGRDEECWVLQRHVLEGNPAFNSVWEDFDKVTLQEFPHRRDVPDMKVSAVVIDSGGHHSMQVYDFCRTRGRRKVWPIVGRGGQHRRVWPAEGSRANKGKVMLYTVGVDPAKERIYHRLKINTPGPGYIHFPMTVDDDFFKQLTAEYVKTTFRNGVPVRTWEKREKDRNEVLDCMVYANAAAAGLSAMVLRQLNALVDILEKNPLKNADSGERKPATVRKGRRVSESY